MDPQQLLMLPLWYAVFLLSLTCHEAGHAWAAYIGGDSTAYHGGQVTLNPLPHMRREPMGTILLPVITFFWIGWMMGWASAPYDPYWADRHPRRAALMAMAGPAANLLLFVLTFIVIKIGLSNGVFVPDMARYDLLISPVDSESGLLGAVARLLSISFSLNLLLLIFNLIPVPPLDGAAIVMGLAPATKAAYGRLLSLPMGSWLGLIVAWVVFPRIFHSVIQPLLALLYGGFS